MQAKSVDKEIGNLDKAAALIEENIVGESYGLAMPHPTWVQCWVRGSKAVACMSSCMAVRGE